MRVVLTPGLTPFQRQQVADVLRRVGLVPTGQLASLFIDVDRAAARVLAVRPSDDDCRVVTADVAVACQVDPLTVSFAFGLAVGIRKDGRSHRRRVLGQSGSARNTSGWRNTTVVTSSATSESC